MQRRCYGAVGEWPLALDDARIYSFAARKNTAFRDRGTHLMNDRFNTIAGWTLFSGIVALGLSSLSGHMFKADKDERPETLGYAIPGVVSSGGAAAAEVPIENLLAKADPAKGKATFQMCMACHTVAQGAANGIGPNLYAIVGDSIAQGRGGFAFSDSLKAKAGKWDFKTLNTWLTNPRAFADGTKMTFAGLDSGEDRANVIAFLNTQGSNLPLPAPVAMPAAGAAAPAAAAVVGDAAHGKVVVAQCGACHSIDAGGANGVGPNLAHIVGDDVGKGRGGFAFTPAIQKIGGKWDEAKLDKWLTSPRDMAPGTMMTFAGLSDAKDRADVIAYLKAN